MFQNYDFEKPTILFGKDPQKSLLTIPNNI